MRDLLAGALAGFTATVPMTLAMEGMHRGLPAPERYPLPPRDVALAAAERAGAGDDLDEAQRLDLTLATHFAIGTGSGAAYACLARPLPLPPVVKGAAFGLALWGAAYLGVLPALGILRPATEHPPRRTGLMIAAHLVWGTVTGLLTEHGAAPE